MTKITYKTLVHNTAMFGTIKCVHVMLIVDLECSKDRTFKLRKVSTPEVSGWDYGANDSKCYEVLNGDLSFEEAFERFI